MTALHISTWPEDRILDYFWSMAMRTDADRVELLQQLAPVVVVRPAEWSPAEVRAAHLAGRRTRGFQCFCCRTGDRRLYWHHVIAIQHGGSNDVRNQVAICLRCHASVHPWLDGTAPDQRPRRGGFESIRDIMMRTFETVEAALTGKGKT